MLEQAQAVLRKQEKSFLHGNATQADVDAAKRIRDYFLVLEKKSCL